MSLEAHEIAAQVTGCHLNAEQAGDMHRVLSTDPEAAGIIMALAASGSPEPGPAIVLTIESAAVRANEPDLADTISQLRAKLSNS